MNKKIDNPLVVVLIFFIFTLIFMVGLIKYFGSTELGNLIERDGYCKSAFEDSGWEYVENKEHCFDLNFTRRLEPRTFTEEEFRIICPKNKFISTKFYSDCFHKGDSRNG